MRPFLLLLAAALFVPASQDAAAQNTIEIREWDVPWEDTRPRDPYVAPDGKVWFVGQTGHYVASLDPASGEFRRIPLADGAGPHNLIVDDEGAIWYAGNRQAHIGRVDPESGEIRQIAMPDDAARDPHTLIFDEAGDIWFTVQGGNFIGKLDVESGAVRLVASKSERSRPYGIDLDSQGRAWVNLLGTNKLAMIDPTTFELTEITLKRADARTRRIGVASDDGVWYVDYAGGYLGRVDPATMEETEWALPSGADSRPYAMAIDSQDRIWLVETGVQPNNFVGFDPKTESFFSSTPVPSGGGTVRHMVFHAPTNMIWFGTDAGTIGRAAVR